MFVDTTALKEQIIDDVILSAFGSSGQRCSALRLLFVPRTPPTASSRA
jgi:RHH-type proline utilization regulon transcriptional repressor/proline dehydrogenase/delta 1-pyrroline-5-carboxylate dehydrogenase